MKCSICVGRHLQTHYATELLQFTFKGILINVKHLTIGDTITCAIRDVHTQSLTKLHGFMLEICLKINYNHIPGRYVALPLLWSTALSSQPT